MGEREEGAMKQKITGVTKNDLENAGLTKVEKEVGLLFWVNGLSIVKIAEKRNVTYPSICIPFYSAQKKLLKLKDFPFAEPAKKNAEKQKEASSQRAKRLQKGVFKIVVSSLKVTSGELRRLANIVVVSPKETAEYQAEQLQKGIILMVATSLSEVAKQMETMADIIPKETQPQQPPKVKRIPAVEKPEDDADEPDEEKLSISEIMAHLGDGEVEEELREGFQIS